MPCVVYTHIHTHTQTERETPVTSVRTHAHTAGGFVQEQGLGLRDQLHPDGDPAFFSPRDPAGDLVPDLGVGDVRELQLVEHREDALGLLGHGQGLGQPEEGAEHDRLDDG